MGTILSRIQELASHEGITIGALERKIGASKGVLSRAINNGTDIQAKWLQIIVENYPLCSADWLLTGKGEMLKVTDTPAPSPVEEPKKDNFLKLHRAKPGSGKGIPLIPMDAVAGFPADGSGSAYLEDCERYVIPEFEYKGADFLIRVSGDSMVPLYYSGDLLACHKIIDIRFFQWGTIYVLETSQGTIVKRVQESAEHADCILCVSENSEIHKPFLLPRDDIRSLSTIVGLVRLV